MIIDIFLVSVFQLGAYFVAHFFKIKHGEIVILLLVLIGHFFIFPGFFIPKPEHDNARCGMPALAITLVFWIFGTLFALITHLLFNAFSKRVDEGNKAENDYFV